MPRCARCNRFRFSSLLINGYCATCAELIRKEAEDKRLKEEQDQYRLAEQKRLKEEQDQYRLAEQKRIVEIKRISEENIQKLTAGMEQFIAEQNAFAAQKSNCNSAYDGPVTEDDQTLMTEEDFENIALLWFPEKAEIIMQEIDDVKGFAYGYLDGDCSNTLIELLNEWTDHTLIWKYCRFLELIWQKGDSRMKNALCVTTIESLGCMGGDVWQRFGYYLSEEFRNWINNVAVPGNIFLSYRQRAPLLTSLHGYDLPGNILPVIDKTGAGYLETTYDPFMLGSYHILWGRIIRFENHPERMIQEVSNLKWVDINSEYHRVTFTDENGRKDCFQVIISHFPTGFLRTNIVDAFLHTVLIVHCLSGMSDPENKSDISNFRCSEEEWNQIPVEQRCADARSMMKSYNGDWFPSNIIDKNPQTGIPELHNVDYYSRVDADACHKLASLISPLPVNTDHFGGELKPDQRWTSEIHFGTKDDCFMTILWKSIWENK